MATARPSIVVSSACEEPGVCPFSADIHSVYVQHSRSWALTARIGVSHCTMICGGAYSSPNTASHLPHPPDGSCDCRVSGGNEEVLVRHFFTTTGWPSTLSTAEYGAFVGNVLCIGAHCHNSLYITYFGSSPGNVLAGKRRALNAAVPDLPLKPGLEE